VSKGEAIEAALRLLNEGYARGLIPEEAYIREDARLRTRQVEIKAWREGQERATKVLRPLQSLRGFPSASPPGGGQTRALGAPPERPAGAFQGYLPFPRRPIRADLPTRLLRRRGLAYGGMLPPAIAKTFTVGQAAVLTVLAWEVLHYGACRKSLGEIADEAGCSRSWAKETIRLAVRAGIVAVERRPRPGLKDDTNVVRIISVDWLTWVKVRRDRQAKGRRAGGIGGSGVATLSNNQDPKGILVTEKPIPSSLGNSIRGFQTRQETGGCKSDGVSRPN
jgi:hypothetical protein